MEDLRLAYLYNNGTDARVYYSKLPDPKAENCEMLFIGPKTLDVPYASKLKSCKHAEPVFNSQQEEILWATHGSIPDGYKGSELSIVDFWRIGKHFSVDAVDRLGSDKSDSRSWTRIGLVPKTLSCVPSVILEGGVMSASVGVHGAQGDYLTTVLMQKQEKGWVEVKYNGGNNDGNTGCEQNKVFSYSGASAAGGIKYVYSTSQHDNEHEWISLDTMKSSNFLNITKDTSLRWQKNSIWVGCAGTEIPAHVFTHSGKVHNLLFVALRPDCAQLISAAAPLKEDGALDTANNKSNMSPDSMDAKQQYVMLDDEPESDFSKREEDYPNDIIPNPPMKDDSCRNLCAFEYQNNLLLLWHGDKGSSGIVGELDANGRIPEDWKFRTVNVKFEQEITGSATSYNFTGVIVPSDFC